MKQPIPRFRIWSSLFLIPIFAALSVARAGDADIVFVLDQSGSMGLSFIYVNTTTNDTSYYSDNNGCPAGTTSPAAVGAAPGANINPKTPVPIQTVVGTVYIWRMTSNTGCASLSGDPKKVRASTIGKGIETIASLSVNSTVGYVPFAGVVWTSARSQRPLTTTTANITTLKNKIIIDSAPNTNYNRGLDSAKRWLDTLGLNLGKNSKHAVIFISDGAPNPVDSNGLAKNTNGTFKYLDKGMPVYSIFLGRATADTAVLLALSDSTRPAGKPPGWSFYRVNPSRPDSFSIAMTAIIHKILDGAVPIAPRISSKSHQGFESQKWNDVRGRNYPRQNLKMPVEISSEYIPSNQ